MHLCSTGFKWRSVALLLLLMIAGRPLFAQKVGLVLSGGGAKGLAHIGMLKALEENNIPIDYIVGTSMGGIVGGFYAAGYSVDEIESIAQSKNFQNWISGKYESDYGYYFQKSGADPSFLEAKLRIDSGFHPRFKASISNDIPLNFALLEMLAQASVNAGFDFDSLFVPFRCVVADIFTQNTIVLAKGSLSNALRGTMSVPFFYRPVKVNGKYVFDGGLYNNFPIDVIKKEFGADVIIGSNTSSKIYNEYPENIDERLLSKMTVFLFLSKSDSTLLDGNGVFINPDLSKFSATDFDPVETYIQAGYAATMGQMDKIKRLIERRVSKEELSQRREKFNSKAPAIRFADIRIKGGNSKQREYVRRMFRQNSQWLSLSDVKEGYYRLVADENFESVYPKVILDSLTHEYIFELAVEADDDLKLGFGGNISTRPISNVFLGFQYNFLDNKSYTLGGKFYSGRFYESAQAFARMDVPWRTPWFLQLNFIFNHWNYLRSSEIFIENLSATFIEQIDRKFEFTLGLPGRNNGRYEFSAANIMLDNRFYFNDLAADSLLSKSLFDGFKLSATFDRSTLNRKQYATRGGRLLFGLYAFTGKEKYAIGELPPGEKRHTWWMARFKNENYFRTSAFSSLGYSIEAVWTNQPSFSTEKSTLLLAPVYYPFPDTRSVYLENLRAQKYLAIGLRNIFTFYDNFDLRLEAHLFKPYKRITDINANFDLTDVSLLGSAALIYNSPLGPVSLNTSYYDDNEKRWGLLFHIGYLIYNKRANE